MNVDENGEYIIEEKFKNIDLPKWPSLHMTSNTVVDHDTVLDIITRSDRFITHYSMQKIIMERDLKEIVEFWNKSGLNKIFKLGDNNIKDHIIIDGIFEKKLNSVYYNMLPMDRIYSNFVYGSNGWIDINGLIHFQLNVGKWPSIEELVRDFQTIIEEWSLPFNATIYNGEHMETYIQPVLNFISDGNDLTLTFPDEDFKNIVDHSDNPQETELETIIKCGGTCGVPYEMLMYEIAPRVRKAVEETLDSL